ncbi:DUF58 domain-containing protein [Sedimentitalea sp. CY04]|uniref:DUF58 domain-containing protein n=1 Tax=Parasedimentitalea denitrificans TaxID=2211118 RepID=A0ABX0WBJ2_9RHOB|nr:DUF58 domain-containing protein [Sedimentitalea sp. CY04]NIZ63040.1 DUF58 domain-containing protein [Sedimentitalea sp. CY04]
MSQRDAITENDPRIQVSADQLRRLGPRARSLSLLPHQPAQSVLNGRHASRLRGRGLNFEELRNYMPGDDVRTIDWKVTARTGEPYVRVYSEERDRATLLLVDQRMSMFFGSQVYMKSVVAAEAAAIAAQRVLAQGDRVGGFVFGDEVIAEHRPQRRAVALHRFLNSVTKANNLLNADLRPQNTIELNDVLQRAARIAGSNALVLVFSDFDGLNSHSESLIRKLAAANDLILFSVTDPLARNLPARMRAAISDGELQADFDASDPALRDKVQQAFRNRTRELEHWSRRYGFPLVPLGTERPALDQMMQHFGLRAGGG